MTKMPSASVDPSSVWRAVMGSSVEIPPVERIRIRIRIRIQSSSSATILNYNFTLSRPIIPCELLSLRFISDPSSDKFCAEMIYPRLQSIAAAGDTPGQDLTMTDPIHNHAWTFRHIYRGAARRRHILSTGWSQYLKSKRLSTGDTVVFMKKKSTEELFVGVRRRGRAHRIEGGTREALEAVRVAAAGMESFHRYNPNIPFKYNISSLLFFGSGLQGDRQDDTRELPKKDNDDQQPGSSAVVSTILSIGSSWSESDSVHDNQLDNRELLKKDDEDQQPGSPAVASAILSIGSSWSVSEWD